MLPSRHSFSLALLTAAVQLHGQVLQPPKDSPAWVIDQFFVQRSFPDKAQHIAGEMEERYATAPTIGSTMPIGATVTYRPLQVDSSEAIYTVFVRDSAVGMDWYAYLYRIRDLWKLAAVRSLALPPLFYMAMDSLRQMSPLPDSLRSFLASMELTAATDSAHQVFFLSHQDVLSRIATEFANHEVHSLSAAPAGLTAPTAELRSLAVQLAGLNLRGVYRNEEYPNCVFVEIGGMIDNEAGFLYAPEGCRVPEMTPELFIYIEPLGNRWFQYKTT